MFLLPNSTLDPRFDYKMNLELFLDYLLPTTSFIGFLNSLAPHQSLLVIAYNCNSDTILKRNVTNCGIIIWNSPDWLGEATYKFIYERPKRA